MPGESRTKRKWWHGTLLIKDRDSGDTLSSVTSADELNPSINNSPYVVFSYPVYSCETGDVPVPAFYTSQSPGYFVFRPSSADLRQSLVNVNTYQDVINLNNRRVFEFNRTAAYSNCDSITPSAYDSFVYETSSNSLSSNVFKYPTTSYYTQIGCCVIELSAPSTDLPPQGIIGRATRVWYLTKREENSSTIYSLYSYDFALVSGALVFRGDIDVSVYPDVSLYDITWMPSTNSLIVLANDGIRRLFPGSTYVDAKLGDVISINPGNVIQSARIFPFDSDIISSYKPKMEFNIYDNKLYLFAPLAITLSRVTTTVPYLFSMQLSSTSNDQLVLLSATSLQSVDFAGTYIIGDLTFPQNFDPYIGAYCSFQGDLTRISTLSGIVPSEFSGGHLSGMNTMAFIKNPDELSSQNLVYSTNDSGQVFSVNTDDGTSNSTSIAIGTTVLGAASTINGEDARLSQFPFVLGNSHWLFLVDISASMSDGSRMERIKSAFSSMLHTYVRSGDEITVVGFNDKTPVRIDKVLLTYADANEVNSFIDVYLNPSGSRTNFCSVLADLSQRFNNLKGIFILSDGTFDDCGTTQSEWDASVIAPLTYMASNGAKITAVGVSSVSSGVLQYIGSVFGTYVDWR
jgi:hypothetical protein